MWKTTQAMLGILLMITMSLSMGLEGMSVNDENINHTSARGETNCTSDEGCPDGYTCSSDGVCEAEQSCDVDGDCPDGETCEDGACENTVHESSCEDTNQETNEDGTCGVCLDGYGLDVNGDCVEDPSLDNSCTSDADCENGQICGAAGECMDAPDDSGNDTVAQEECAAGGGTWTPSPDSDGEYYCDMGSENETNDGGGEAQYRNCSFDSRRMYNGIQVCDDETGEWVELEDTRPTSVEIGCDEEPTEEQLDASNFADLLNEHDEILIRDGNNTYYMAKSGNYSRLVEDSDSGDWDVIWNAIGGNVSPVATGIYVENSASGEVIFKVMAGYTSFNGSTVIVSGGISGGNGGTITEYGYYMSFSTCGNGSGGLGCPGDDVVWMGFGGGEGGMRYQASVEFACESNPPTNLSGCYWVMAGGASFNGSTVDIGLSNDRLIALFMMLNSAGGNGSWGGSGGLNLPFTSISNGSGTLIADSYVIIWSVNLGGTNDGNWLNSEDDPEWIYVSLGGVDVNLLVLQVIRYDGGDGSGGASFNGWEPGEYLFLSFSTGNQVRGNTMSTLSGYAIYTQDTNVFDLEIDGNTIYSENLMFADFDNGMRVESIQIDMDENGNVTNVNIVKQEACAAPDIIEEGDSQEEETSASGDVDITGAGDVADLTVVGGAGLLAGIGISSILGQTGRGGGGLGSSGASKRKRVDRAGLNEYIKEVESMQEVAKSESLIQDIQRKDIQR